MDRSKILVTGGSGMVGTALKKILPEAIYLASQDGDLRNEFDVAHIFKEYKPQMVFHLAGKVGGVKANMDHLGDFFYDNILMNTNVLDACRQYNVKKVLSLLSTCVYPDDAKYPLSEEQIHNGIPHHTNFAYAHAKRMLDVQSRAYRIQHGCNFITAIPNNIFGLHDNFDLENSHVIPAIIRKVYEAKQKNEDVVLWGDGKALREFTDAEDLAKILLFVMESYDDATSINVGNTNETSIKNTVETIANIFNFKGEIIWDISKPKGQYRKPMDNSKLIELGWDKNEFKSLSTSLEKTCRWFEKEYPNVRGVE